MNNEVLVNRVKQFTDELGIPYSAFARNVGLSAVTIYKWISRHIDLSEKVLKRISEYLNRYNF